LALIRETVGTAKAGRCVSSSGIIGESRLRFLDPGICKSVYVGFKAGDGPDERDMASCFCGASIFLHNRMDVFLTEGNAGYVLR